jgi:hypothetical protein
MSLPQNGVLQEALKAAPAGAKKKALKLSFQGFFTWWR